MKFSSLTAIFILFAALTASSQVAEKLRVTGTVVSLNTHAQVEKREKIAKWPGERITYQYQPGLTISIQFTNLTDHPLIILKPAFLGPTMELLFLREIFSTDEISGGSFLYAFGFRYAKDLDERFTKEARRNAETNLLEKIPPESFFKIIPANGQYETIVNINNVESGYKVEERIGKSPTDFYYVVVPKYPALKVRFTLKTDSTKGSALINARDNWRNYGELVLDADGDYDIKSDVILNPSAPTK